MIKLEVYLLKSNPNHQGSFTLIIFSNDMRQLLFHINSPFYYVPEIRTNPSLSKATVKINAQGTILLVFFLLPESKAHFLSSNLLRWHCEREISDIKYRS